MKGATSSILHGKCHHGFRFILKWDICRIFNLDSHIFHLVKKWQEYDQIAITSMCGATTAELESFALIGTRTPPDTTRRLIREMNGLQSYKVCLLGDQGVGKTSIKQSFFGIPFHSHYMMTRGADFTLKEVDIKGETIQLQLWDVSGHCSVKNVIKRYIQDADGIILVFDLTRNETFHNITAWIREIITTCTKSVVLLIIGNKADLKEQLTLVPKHEIDSLINHLHKTVIAKHFLKIGYFSCSAKAKLNIDEVFLSLILAKDYWQ